MASAAAAASAAIAASIAFFSAAAAAAATSSAASLSDSTEGPPDTAQDVRQLTLNPSFLELSSVSGLVSNVWYRILLDQSELSISKIPPTDSLKVRTGYDP